MEHSFFVPCSNDEKGTAMSDHQQRLTAPVVAFSSSLADDLRRVDCAPLAERWVRRGMYAASLGLRPDAWKWTVLRAARDRHQNGREQWVVFTLDDYLIMERRIKGAGTHQQYGTPIPLQLLGRAQRAANLPGVKVEVHALLSDDPFVFAVRSDGERCCIGAWYGQGSMRQLYLR